MSDRDAWAGTENEPCDRCRGICTYCIVALRDRQPASDLKIVAANDGGHETSLHICEPHKRFMMGDRP